jgi:hypothetical protein
VAQHTKKPAAKPAAEEQEEKITPKASLGGKPRFVRCQIVGPDGKTRSGWEMWLGEHCFGRADRKEMLIRSLERQQQPPQSFHWREVHRQRFERTRWQRTGHWPSEEEARETQ